MAFVTAGETNITLSMAGMGYKLPLRGTSMQCAPRLLDWSVRLRGANPNYAPRSPQLCVLDLRREFKKAVPHSRSAWPARRRRGVPWPRCADPAAGQPDHAVDLGRADRVRHGPADRTGRHAADVRGGGKAGAGRNARRRARD